MDMPQIFLRLHIIIYTSIIHLTYKLKKLKNFFISSLFTPFQKNWKVYNQSPKRKQVHKKIPPQGRVASSFLNLSLTGGSHIAALGVSFTS